MKRFSGSVPFCVFVPRDVRERLALRCFRGIKEQKAGNFCGPMNFWAVLDDRCVGPQFQQHVERSILEVMSEGCAKKKFSFTVTHDRYKVGWASAVPQGQLPSEVNLKPFKPNGHTRAMEVVNPEVLAPLTNDISFVIDIYRGRERGDWMAEVVTIYPGQLVRLGYGRGTWDIVPEQAVFFDWEHPGEPLR